MTDGDGALAALTAAGWDELLARAGNRDPLRRTAVLSLPDPLGPRAPRPRAILVERGGRAVAGAALGVARERGLATVRHLGHGPNWFDPEPPAIDAGARDALADALVRQPGDILLLEDLAADGDMVKALVQRSPDAELIPGPWSFLVRSETLVERTASRRREAGRLARRAADRGTPLEVAVLSGWDDIAPHVPELLALQAAAWVGRDPDDFTGTEAGRAFVGKAVAALGAEGRVRLVRLDVGGRLAAFHLSLVWGSRAVIYKTAFDRDLALPGLGWASLIAALDQLSVEGVRLTDLGPWGGSYKTHVADTRQTLAVRIPLSPVGRAYLRAAAVKHAAARRLQRASP